MGLSQQELADQAGVGRGWLSTLETGAVANPAATRLAQLAGALGVSVGDLLNEESRGAIVMASQITEARRTAGTLLNLLAEMDPTSQSEGVKVMAVATQALKASLHQRTHNALDSLTAAQVAMDMIQGVRETGSAWVVGALVAGAEPNPEIASTVASMLDEGQV